MPSIAIRSLFALAVLCCFVHSFASKDAQQLAEDGKVEEEKRKCWTNQNGNKTAKWYSEGEKIESGLLVYECHGAKLMPIGCLDEFGQQIRLNDTTVANGLLMQCSLTQWATDAQLKIIGCLPEGQPNRTILVGETWTDKESQTWWECAAEGATVRARLGGCVDEASRSRLRMGESIDREQTTFECQSKGVDAAQMVAVGCVTTGDGEHHRIGQQWQVGDFLFYCKRTAAGVCEKSCVGCLLEGRRLYDGDRFQHKRTVFQCEIRPKRHALNPVACISENGVERLIDCKWSDQSKDGTYRVKRNCVMREGRADIDTLGCVFEKNGVARLTLKAGTFTLWRENFDKSPVAVSCRRALIDGDEWPLLETFPVAELTERTNGLKEDKDPRI